MGEPGRRAPCFVYWILVVGNLHAPVTDSLDSSGPQTPWTHTTGGRCFRVRVFKRAESAESALLESAGGSCRDIKRAESAESAEVRCAKLGRLEESRHLVVLNFGGPH